jgi:5-methylcytosine-specific restriction protein A
MPHRIATGCMEPGCPEISSKGNRCGYHARQAQIKRDRRRGSAAARGYGARWRRLRAMYLRANPRCVDPFEVHETLMLANTVDHVLPKSEGGTDVWDNLQSLCASCHNRKTASEDGRWGRGGPISTT